LHRTPNGLDPGSRLPVIAADLEPAQPPVTAFDRHGREALSADTLKQLPRGFDVKFGRPLPDYVRQEFDAYLRCGRLEHGFLRVRCESCHAEHLVAFSCKRRGFCPSCGARRMAESAALLVEEVFPEKPVRQRVLSVPYPLRFLFASEAGAWGDA
jgi:ribosomal protein S27E